MPAPALESLPAMVSAVLKAYLPSTSKY